MAESLQIPRPRFTAGEALSANEDWGFNCGPAAIGAICGLTPSQIRWHMGDIEEKGYTNPTLMKDTLARLSRRYDFQWAALRDLRWPTLGLVRIQWEGPWTQPRVPAKARYRHTHWVGAAVSARGIGIWDLNALGNGTGWCSLEHWETVIVPWILRDEPKADGRWHRTHVIEITQRPVERSGGETADAGMESVNA